MPRVIPGLLNQVLVYWPKGTIRRDGEYEIGTPVEVVCRWETTHTEASDINGSTFISQAQLYFQTNSVDLGGWVWLSTARTSDPAGTALAQAPATPPNNQIIRTKGITPSVGNTETLYTAMI